MALAGTSGELVAASATGSAARAQHPHVTQAGGQSLSLLPAGSLTVHGSALTRLTKPEALNVSTATMMARANRRTMNKCNTQAAERRDCPLWPRHLASEAAATAKELRPDESAHRLYAPPAVLKPRHEGALTDLLRRAQAPGELPQGHRLRFGATAAEYWLKTSGSESEGRRDTSTWVIVRNWPGGHRQWATTCDRRPHEDILESTRAIDQKPVAADALAERAPLGKISNAAAPNGTSRSEFDLTREALHQVGRVPPLEIHCVPNGERDRG